MTRAAAGERRGGARRRRPGPQRRRDGGRGTPMGLEVGGLFALLILFADAWAILNVVGSRASLPAKAAWVVAILALPLLGLLAWLAFGPRA